MKRATEVGAVALAVAAGAATGAVVERLLMRGVFRSLLDEDEPFGSLHSSPVRVTADDGTRLYAEIDEPDDPAMADITIVFSHGYSLNLDTWHFQRRDLRGKARLVFWDQRSHGRSGRAPADTHTINQLGRDLGRVIDECAPTGTLILVGHSMGGMTIMGLADEQPELFGGRVQGVGLVATSSGRLSEVTFRLPARAARVMQGRTDQLAAAMIARAERLDRRRTRTTDLEFLLTKRLSFGGPVSRGQARFVADLLDSTPIEVVAEYLPEFGRHDKLEALAALERVQTLVIVGDTDALTPDSHSREIVRRVPGAELVVLPRSGHMVITERHDEVNARLEELLATVRSR